jgi:hypothetical protein
MTACRYSYKRGKPQLTIRLKLQKASSFDYNHRVTTAELKK